MGVLCWSGVFSFEFSYSHPLHHHHDSWSMIRKQGAPFLRLKLILWCVVRSYLGNVHTALALVIKSFSSSSWCRCWWWWWGSKDFPFVTFFLGWPVWGIYYTQSLQNTNLLSSSSSSSSWSLSSLIIIFWNMKLQLSISLHFHWSWSDHYDLFDKSEQEWW